MEKGKVKFFNSEKGCPDLSLLDNGSDDLFVHVTQLTGVEGGVLAEGDVVEYDVVEGRKGPMAGNVVKTDAA